MCRHPSFIVLSAVLLIGCQTTALCKVEVQIASCAAKIVMPIHVLKNNCIHLSHPNMTNMGYSYVVANDRLCESKLLAAEKLAARGVVTLFDSQRNVFGSNKTQKRLSPSLSFYCTITRIFYLRHLFEDFASYVCHPSVDVFPMHDKTVS
jgi:hypothetical protein